MLVCFSEMYVRMKVQLFHYNYQILFSINLAMLRLICLCKTFYLVHGEYIYGKVPPEQCKGAYTTISSTFPFLNCNIWQASQLFPFLIVRLFWQSPDKHKILPYTMYCIGAAALVGYIKPEQFLSFTYNS